MISSEIWNFSETNKIARARRASPIWGLWKIYKCFLIPNCTRKIMWLLINNTVEPPFATTSRKRPPLISDHFFKIQKIFKLKLLKIEPLVGDHLS